MTRTLQVLVVEDEPAIRRAVERALTRGGYQVLLAATGEEAAELLRSYQPDAILMDLRMPGMSGETLYHLIAGQYPKLKSRIIVMTGDPEAEDQAEWLEVHRPHVLVKPFELSQLEALLREVCTQEQEQGQNHQADPS